VSEPLSTSKPSVAVLSFAVFVLVCIASERVTVVEDLDHQVVEPGSRT
jgi:hypothetical protein